jgi:TPR repeat protein
MPLVVLAIVLLAAGCSESSRLRGRCSGGEVSACTQLGEMYATGTRVARDMGRAAEMYEKACSLGAVEVCNTLGEIYERAGQELEGGMTRAEELFRFACNGGSAPGCLNLGEVAASRDDKKHAAELFERSCTGGWTPGCHRLATAFDQGEGVLQDLNRAIALYEEACATKYAESCVSAGMLFMTGQRVERDVARATRHFGTALKVYDDSCQAGNEVDCKERDKLRTRVAILAASQQ